MEGRDVTRWWDASAPGRAILRRAATARAVGRERRSAHVTVGSGRDLDAKVRELDWQEEEVLAHK